MINIRQSLRRGTKIPDVNIVPKNSRALLMVVYCALHMKDFDMAKETLTKAAHFPGKSREVKQMPKSIELASNKGESR